MFIRLESDFIYGKKKIKWNFIYIIFLILVYIIIAIILIIINRFGKIFSYLDETTFLSSFFFLFKSISFHFSLCNQTLYSVDVGVMWRNNEYSSSSISWIFCCCFFSNWSSFVYLFILVIKNYLPPIIVQFLSLYVYIIAFITAI